MTLIFSRALSSLRSSTNKIAVIMGKPGGGKGTISKWLVNDFGFNHLSSGDMLRSHLENKTPLGLKAKDYMNAGKLVPDDLMVDMVVSAIKQRMSKSSSPILLDGFPRTVPQAQALDDNVHIHFVLSLEVPNEEIVQRISDRWVHPESGRVYSYKFNPPKVHGKDDHTGDKLIRRADDEPDKVKERLRAYENMTAPVAGHYAKKSRFHSFCGKEYPELVQLDKRSEAIYKMMKPMLEKEFLK